MPCLQVAKNLLFHVNTVNTEVTRYIYVKMYVCGSSDVHFLKVIDFHSEGS